MILGFLDACCLSRLALLSLFRIPKAYLRQIMFEKLHSLEEFYAFIARKLIFPYGF